MPSRIPTLTSLQKVYRGNPDIDTGSLEPDSIRMDRHELVYTAYDTLIEGNPDL